MGVVLVPALEPDQTIRIKRKNPGKKLAVPSRNSGVGGVGSARFTAQSTVKVSSAVSALLLADDGIMRAALKELAVAPKKAAKILEDTARNFTRLAVTVIAVRNIESPLTESSICKSHRFPYDKRY
jgi:hypothetical protein